MVQKPNGIAEFEGIRFMRINMRTNTCTYDFDLLCVLKSAQQ